MKARTRKTRWLLAALLFGLLTAAGITLTHHRPIWMITYGKYIVPTHSVLGQPQAAVVASIAGDQTLGAPAGETYSNSRTVDFSRHSDEPSDTATASNTSNPAVDDRSNHATGVVGGSSHAAAPQSTPPSQSASSGRPPQNGAGQFAYNSYVPLDCELPAGCGVSGSGGSLNRQPSGTSGGTPFLRDSGSDTPGGSQPPPGNTQNNDPPGSPQNPPARAPELDPATLAGAVTLLLGSLAVLLKRRVRATR